MLGDRLGRKVSRRGTDLLDADDVVGQSAEIGQVLVEQHVDDGEQQRSVGAGARRYVEVGHLGGTRPVRIQHHQPAAALADRFELSDEIGCGGETSVGHQRVSADDYEVIGAIEIGNRERNRRAVHVPARDVFGHLIQRAGGEDVPGSQRTDDAGCVQPAGDGVGVGVTQIDPDR